MPKVDSELVNGISMGEGINLGVFWTVALWILSTFGALCAAYSVMLQSWIKSELKGKMDRAEAAAAFDRVIETYHNRTVRDLKADFERKHEENRAWQERIEDKGDRLLEMLVKRSRGGVIP